MKLLVTFNFDIIIIIIAFFGIVFGFYRGFYKQLQKTASLFLPLIILYFLLPFITKLMLSNDAIVGIAKLLIFPKLEVHLYLIMSLLIGTILYVFLAATIYLIFKIVQKKDINYYLIKKNKYGRVIASFISLLSSYIIVFVLLYVTSPFINNANGPITDFLENSTLEVNEIGTLHLYQNNNKNEFIETKNLFDILSGNAIVETFNNFALLEDSVNEIEQLLDNVYDSLNSDSQDLLRNEKTVNKLMEKKNKKYIIDLVWKIEKKNEVFKEIYEKRNFLLDNLGFINILNLDYFGANDLFIEKIIEEKGIIEEFFVTKNSLNKFQKMISEYEFYFFNKTILQTLIDESNLDIYIYNQAVKHIFSDNILMFSYVTKFREEFVNTESDVAKDLIKVFNDIEENKAAFLEIEENLSFGTKVVLANNYRRLVINQEWIKSSINRSYFIDEFLNEDSIMNLLHKEMLFIYLIPDYSIVNKIDNEDIDTLFNKLNLLVEQDLFYLRDVNNILKMLFDGNILLENLLINELISSDTITYAKGLIV